MKSEFEKSQQEASLRKAQIQKGLIHVSVTLDPDKDGAAEETLLAYPIGGNYAQIASIPFFASNIGIDDIVETEITADLHRDFVAVVKKNTNTFYGQFDGQFDDDDKEVCKDQILSDYFIRFGLRIETFAPGIFALAVPVYFDQLDEAIRDAPFQLTIEEDA
jgi:hypothetical protein